MLRAHKHIGLVRVGLAVVLALAAWGSVARAEDGAHAYLPIVFKPPRASITPTPSRTATRTRTPTPSATPTRTTTPDAAAAYAAQVVALTNAERAARGIAPLQANALLASAAQAHSLDMATHNYLGHIGSDGSDPEERIDRVGYAWSAWGENVAGGYASPQAVVVAWMGSAGHRANILDPDFTEIGVGYVYRSGTYYGHYWTQVFGRPR